MARVRVITKLPEAIECWRRRGFLPAYNEVAVTLRPTSPISPSRTVRKMMEGDLDTGARLYEAFINHEAALGAPWRLVPGWQAAWIERMRARLRHPDSAIFVMEADGRMAGMAVGGLVNQPGYLSPPRYGRIEYVIVSEPYRKRGLGHALAQRLLAHFQATVRIMQVHAQLWHTDTVGRSFWRKLELDDLALWLYRPV
jgi:ribosomal protein S18 acetylase RimI-like enzyme